MATDGVGGGARLIYVKFGRVWTRTPHSNFTTRLGDWTTDNTSAQLHHYTRQNTTTLHLVSPVVSLAARGLGGEGLWVSEGLRCVVSLKAGGEPEARCVYWLSVGCEPPPRIFFEPA